MRASRPIAAVAVPALALAGLLAGCSEEFHDPEVDPGTGVVSRGIDARSYVDDYESEVDEDVQYSASGSGAADGAGPAPLPPGPGEDNTFVDAGTSGVVATADDPRSTFALDVDTGSLGVARALLAAGERVPAAAIRPEEWVNAFPYDDPAPTDQDLAVTAETAPGLVRVGVAAREVAPADRPRVNVTLVVDRSGSMDIRERLGLVQSSLAVLADRLRDDDTVSVVSFEDDAKPVLEPTPVAETARILEAVERLRPGGSTNLEAGLALGYEQARAAFDPDGVNLVVLCSDGVANVGATGPGSIVDRIAEEGADGIHLVTVGYGMGNYDDHLMEQLADRGDGFYAYVDTFAEAERLFGTDLTTTLVPVAEEARAQVAFDPAAVASYRLVGYENRALVDEEYDDLGVDAGELGSGHRATALYEVELADGVAPGTVLGTASVRWRSPGGGAAEAATDIVAAAADEEPGDDVALASAVADLAALLKAEPGDAAGLAALRDRATALAARDVPGAADLLELVDLASIT